MGFRNNFGQVNDVRATVNIPLQASVAFKYLSGKFVTQDSNQRIGLSVAGDTKIIGWAAGEGEYTSSATAGADSTAINIAKDAVYEMPIDSTETEAALIALIGKTCDIIVTGGIQYADIDASSDDILQIVGYHYQGPNSGEQTVLVRLHQPNLTVSGVA